MVNKHVQSRLRPLDTLAWNNEIGPRRSILLVLATQSWPTRKCRGRVNNKVNPDTVGTIGYVVLPTGVSTDVSRDII